MFQDVKEIFPILSLHPQIPRGSEIYSSAKNQKEKFATKKVSLVFWPKKVSMLIDPHPPLFFSRHSRDKNAFVPTATRLG